MERINIEKAPHYTLLILFLNLLALLFVLIFTKMASTKAEGWWGFLIAAPLMAWGALSFSNMHYELTEKEFIAWLWPFNSKTAYSEMKSVEVHPRFPWIVGFGMHWFQRTWWFTTRYQACVLIDRKNGSKIAFTPKDPQAFAKLLRERMKRATKAKRAKAKKKK